MNLIRPDNGDLWQEAGERRTAYPLSYPELCSGFLTSLSKAAKSAALYGASHPVVTESVARAYAGLKELLKAGGGELTLASEGDYWLFNETQVPAVTQDALNMSLLFRGHGVSSAVFRGDVSAFDLSAFCELLGTAPKGLAAGGFPGLLAQKGVTGITAGNVRYFKERGGQAPAPAGRPRKDPRPPAAVPAPGTPREGAAETPAPAAQAPRPARPSAAAAPPAGPERKDAVREDPAGALAAFLTRLVESMVKDPVDRAKVYQEALQMIKQTLQEQVRLTTKSLAEEKELILNSRTRTEHVLAKVAEGKVIVDKEGKILMMNPAAEAISGKRLAEVAGKHVTEHLKPGEHFLTLSGDMDLGSGAALTGRVDTAGDDQIGLAMRRSMALLEDDEGRVVGAYITLPELTKFKEAQHLQDEFLSKVTHDLQSPLASISSALEMLTDTAGGKLDQDERKFLSISVRNSRRLTDMIRGILDFSKLQSGKLSVNPEPSDLAPILAEASEGLLPWARTKGIQLSVRRPQSGIRVQADPRRIVQVITNLLSNAIKSTPGGGSVVLAAALAAAPEPCAIIGVRDTGPGIARQDMERIFEKFTQLEGDGPREGVGLGLSIVKELVGLHKGRIWAESEPGKGATFYFTLPLAEDGGGAL